MRIALPFVLVTLAVTSDWSNVVASPPATPTDDFDRVVVPVGASPAPVAIADINHDGFPDVLVGNAGDSTLSVLLNDGHRHFRPAPGSPFACGHNPNDIVVADMNGDGHPDVVIANTGTPDITILLGDGKGGFRPAPESPFATAVRP